MVDDHPPKKSGSMKIDLDLLKKLTEIAHEEHRTIKGAIEYAVLLYLNNRKHGK